MTQLVMLDDLEFNWGPGAQGRWWCTDIDGWYSPAPVRGGSDELPTGDGASEPDVNFRSARALTFSGYVVGPSVAASRETFLDAIAALQSDGRPFEMSVENEFGKRTLTVSINGRPTVLPTKYHRAAEVAVPLIAYDPVKYGPPKTVTTGLPTSGGGLAYPLHSPGGALSYGVNGNLGRVTLFNEGTTQVWPSVLVTGGLTSGFFVQRLDTGQVVRYDRQVPNGSTVLLDFRTGEVLIDGESDGSTYLTRYEYFAAAPREPFEVQFNAIGGSVGTPIAAFTIKDGFR